MSGHRVAVVGFGTTGRAVTRALLAAGDNVVVFDDLFNGVIDTHAMNFVPKPRQEAYATLLAQGQFDPKRAALFDDSMRNLAPARAMGMKTVWFNHGLGLSSHFKLDAPLVIGIVSFTRPHPKVPAWEQELSAGASAMNIVTAATALGYGANWLTGWFAFDRDVLDGFGLKPEEKLAGLIHIGTPSKPSEDRPRPSLSDIVTRF